MAVALTVVLAGCSSDLGYDLVCEDVMGDGSDANVDCIAIVEAVRAEMEGGETVTQAAVWAYVGCPPGAYCALAAGPQPSPPASALIGVRTSDDDTSVWVVSDVSAWQLSPSLTLGYHPDEFSDGLARSAAASRAP